MKDQAHLFERWINLYPVHNAIGFSPPKTYSVDSVYLVDSTVLRSNNRDRTRSNFQIHILFTTYVPAKGGSILTPQIQDSAKVLTIPREGPASVIGRVRVSNRKSK